MAAKIFYQEDCNLSLLDGKTIAIIGYSFSALCQGRHTSLHETALPT